MNNYLENLRILIVEDDQPTADVLQLEFGDAFPHVQVDWACAVAPAEEFLSAAAKAGFSYDVAILDYMLPTEQTGGPPAPDAHVHNKILKGSPETVVIHVSAYDGDPRIRRLREDDAEEVKDCVAFVMKGGDWEKELIDQIGRAIHCRRIRGRLAALSLSPEGPSSEWHSRGLSPVRSDCGRSLAVAECCVDAAQHWNSLSPNLQDHLKSTFGFAMIDGNPCLGVAEELDEETDVESNET